VTLRSTWTTLLGEGAPTHVITAWYDRLFARIDDLGVWPRMYAVDEVYSAEVGRVMRKMNYQRYLVFYEVNDAAKIVKVDAFFHGARRG